MVAQSEETTMALMGKDIKTLLTEVHDIKTDMKDGYVSLEAHKNVLRRLGLLEKIVYGAVGMILLIVVGALVSLVVKQ